MTNGLRPGLKIAYTQIEKNFGKSVTDIVRENESRLLKFAKNNLVKVGIKDAVSIEQMHNLKNVEKAMPDTQVLAVSFKPSGLLGIFKDWNLKTFCSTKISQKFQPNLFTETNLKENFNKFFSNIAK